MKDITINEQNTLKAYLSDRMYKLNVRLSYQDVGLYFIENNGEHTVSDRDFIQLFREYQEILRNNRFVSFEDYFGSRLDKDPDFQEYIEEIKDEFYRKIFFEAPAKIEKLFEKLFDISPYNEMSVPRHVLYNVLKDYVGFKGIKVRYSSFVPSLRVNLELGTNSDLRSDFTAILSAVRENVSDLELQKKTDVYNNALSKVINMQGYSVPMVAKAYYLDDRDTGSVFVDSVINALKNFNGEKAALFLLSYAQPKYSSDSTLSFLQSVACAEVCAKTDNPRVKSNVHFQYDNTVALGIYDPSGKGEPQFIRLEKDISFAFDLVSGITFQRYEQGPLHNYCADPGTLKWTTYNLTDKLYLRSPAQHETLADVIDGMKSVQSELSQGLG